MPAAPAADLAAAVVALWAGAGLDSEFTQYWPEADRTEFIALNDEMAAPDQPFPYCVFTQGAGNTVTRTSGTGAAGRYEVRDVPLEFKIFARAAGGRAAKDIAADLAARILAIFGGHPTVTPAETVLEHGGVLLTQYQSELPVRMGEDEYAWVINYTYRIDTPQAA